MFYECVLIIRPDVSLKQIKTIVSTIRSLVENSQGRVEKGEYWGFRTLAYRIAKRAKAHYICLGLFLPAWREDDELNRHLKFHKDVLRFLFIKQPKGLEFPTPLCVSSLDELENTENYALTGEAL